MKKQILTAWFISITVLLNAQDDLPQDYLTKEFHAGRREAARQLMPANSVMLVLSSPERNYSNDVDYLFHQNPDMYYFTGYKEPNALLLIFKENQTTGSGEQFNEVLFVNERNAAAEQWTGKRLGIEGAKEKLGFNIIKIFLLAIIFFDFIIIKIEARIRWFHRNFSIFLTPKFC